VHALSEGARDQTEYSWHVGGAGVIDFASHAASNGVLTRSRDGLVNVPPAGASIEGGGRQERYKQGRLVRLLGCWPMYRVRAWGGGVTKTDADTSNIGHQLSFVAPNSSIGPNVSRSRVSARTIQNSLRVQSTPGALQHPHATSWQQRGLLSSLCLQRAACRSRGVELKGWSRGVGRF
jgi:hypothetical protein